MKPYRPSKTEYVTNFVVRGLTALLCKVDARQLTRVPKGGPLIIVTNHINFLEAPVIYVRLSPRPVTGFSKIESWDSAFIGWLFDVWGIIPIHRGEADKSAFRAGLQALKDGQILTIAPEGTRSGDGQLGKGLPGVVLLALMSGAPMIPLVHYGHQDYKQNWRKIHRAPLKVVVGHPFRLEPGEKKVTGETRQEMVDEIMYQLAALLPPEHRGVYHDLSKATEVYLRFDSPARSNLLSIAPSA